MDVAGLALSCISVIRECSFVAERLMQIYRDYKNVPRHVKVLSKDLDGWVELLVEVHEIVKKGEELLGRAIRARLKIYWDDIKALLDDGKQLIDMFDHKQYLKEADLVDLAKSFKEERARLHIWINLAHLKIAKRSSGEIDTIANNTTQTKDVVNKIWGEVRRLQNNPVLRPDFNQSLTDLGQLADGELSSVPIQEEGESSKKGKAVDQRATCPVNVRPETPRPVYVDMGTQTEPFASSSGPRHELPPLSEFPPEIDLDALPNSSDFPLWVNGVPTEPGATPRSARKVRALEEIEEELRLLGLVLSIRTRAGTAHTSSDAKSATRSGERRDDPGRFTGGK